MTINPAGPGSTGSDPADSDDHSDASGPSGPSDATPDEFTAPAGLTGPDGSWGPAGPTGQAEPTSIAHTTSPAESAAAQSAAGTEASDPSTSAAPDLLDDEPFDQDVTIRTTEPEARANLAAVLALVARGKLKCSATSQRPSEITVRMVEEVLARGDYYGDEEIAAFAWPLLLLSGGLALLDGPWMRLTARGRTLLDTLRPTAATPAPESAASNEPESQTTAALTGLWTRWLTKAPIDELMRIDAIRGQRIPGTLTAPTKRRAAVAAGLSALPADGWVSVDRMLRIVRHQEPPLVVPRNKAALGRLFLEEPDRGSLGHPGQGEWDILEGRYALCVAFEYAATLGLLDVAYRYPDDARDDFRQNWGVRNYRYLSRYDGLVAVRRTALGTSVFNPPA